MNWTGSTLTLFHTVRCSGCVVVRGWTAHQVGAGPHGERTADNDNTPRGNA